MIQLNDIRFSYDGKKDILNIDALEIPRGKVTLLAGTNGSGKSTLLALLAGIHLHDAGTVTLKGTSAGEKELRAACRMVMQDPDLQILGATVREDAMLGRDISDENTVVSIAQRFGFDALWNAPVHSLSYGMKKRLCLVSALADRPDVLLLDEPFSGLDYYGIENMRRIIAENKRNGLTQVISSHDLECVVDLTDVLAVVSEGRIPVCGEPRLVLDVVREYGVRPPCSWTHGRFIRPWDAESAG